MSHSGRFMAQPSWVLVAALTVGLALVAISVALGVAEGVAADEQHRAGSVSWLLALSFMSGVALAAGGFVGVLAAHAHRHPSGRENGSPFRGNRELAREVNRSVPQGRSRIRFGRKGRSHLD